MQNNFDKLNEIFGIKPKAEPDEAKDKAAEDSGLCRRPPMSRSRSRQGRRPRS